MYSLSVSEARWFLTEGFQHVQLWSHSCKRTEHKDIAMLEAEAGPVAEELANKTNHVFNFMYSK